jgi:hypothetical protein
VIGVRLLEHFQVTVRPARLKTFTLVNGAAKCKAALASAAQRPRRADVAARDPLRLHPRQPSTAPRACSSSTPACRASTSPPPAAPTRSPASAPRRCAATRPRSSTVDDFSIGELLHASKLRGAYGYFEQGESSDQFRIDGMFGLDVLARRRVTLDFPERKLYFSDPAPREAAK